MDETECEAILDRNPFDKFARLRLSQIWIWEERNLVEAKKLLESILNSDQKFMRCDIFELLGDLEFYETNKNYPLALENYKTAHYAKRDNIDIIIKMAKVHEKLREFDESIVYLKKALSKDKTNFIANYRLGCLYIRNNMKDEGLMHLKEAHRLDPEDVDTMIKLGEIYSRDDHKLDQAQ